MSAMAPPQAAWSSMGSACLDLKAFCAPMPRGRDVFAPMLLATAAHDRRERSLDCGSGTHTECYAKVYTIRPWSRRMTCWREGRI